MRRVTGMARVVLYCGRLSLAPLLGSVALGVAVLSAAGCGDSSLSPAGGSTTATETSVLPPCDQDPHAGVHDPTRLKIFDPCATFIGKVVEGAKLAGDGDVTFNAAPEPGYESMLNQKNRGKGGLHIEIVPRDQPGCTRGEAIKGPVKNLGVCSGAHVLYPPLRARVRVIGAYVLDTWDGWNEMHPAWKVEILPSTGPVPPEARRFKAGLTGQGAGTTGARRGSGRVALTLTGPKACWRFTRITGISRPTRATIRAGKRRAGFLLALGARYRSRGCVTADEERLNRIEEKPGFYYVRVATARYRLGAISGQLTPVSD
jgi:hypothetical protein